MTLPDFRPRWRTFPRPACITSHALPHAIDVLSGVLLRIHSLRRRACNKRASVSHLARHPLRHLTRITLHAVAHIHMRNGVHSNVQTAFPGCAMPTTWLAFAGWPTAPCAAPPGHRIPMPSGRGKMQGKIKGSGTLPAWKRVCTWGWRGTRLWAAPCRSIRQGLAGIGKTACLSRLDAMALAGAAT
ncbi:hypothetical protein [Comamonas sp.]|uniref:hypothetical protein n=1 Tax=Comamonas sp. TaxID=34028 RepID=UPI002896F866|nr:hypothetical protein [Comamonas sp.]